MFPQRREAVLGGRGQRVTIVFHLDLCVVLFSYEEHVFVRYGHKNSGKYLNKISADSALPEVTIGVPPRADITLNVSIKF